MADFEYAKDKVLMGTERRSMAMTDEEKKLTAYHEAGHALVGMHVEGCDPLHKVTIIPRGRALGVTMSLPERDRYTYSLYELKAKIAMMFGGRIAEELIFGKDHVTTGAGNDIKEATNLARRMITEYGFSEKLGPLRYEDNQEEVFLGHSVSQHKNVADATAKVIDDEIRALVEEGERRARAVLTKHLDDLHVVARGLLEYETLSAKEVNQLLAGEGIDRSELDEPTATTGPRSSVPTSGHQPGRKDRPSGGLEPEPQPQG
jgi:cell division protease FtsH